MQNAALVERIWEHSSGEFAFVSTKHQGMWVDYPITSDEVGYPFEEQPHGHDLYFSALRSTTTKRGNEFFGGSALLFADLDPVDPFTLAIKPSIAWETSPGSYQAIWFLKHEITSYERWANLNQRMTRHAKADAGGWMGSKVLRWPGSLNWKRADAGMVPFGKVLWEDGPAHSVDALRVGLPELKAIERAVAGDHPTTITSKNPATRLRYLRRKHWDQLNARSRSMVSRKKVVDRSLFVAKTAKQLIHDGLSPEDAFHLIWVQPWCKWRTDRDAPEVLWNEIRKATG